ncbi:MAG: DUF1893 domain-containing protein [Thermoproteota archaeon]
MDDLEIAKKILTENDSSLVIVKSGEILYESGEHSIIGLVSAIDKKGARLKGASVADKVVGRAAAMLCQYAGFSSVYAKIISEKGYKVLRKKGINLEYDKMVSEILNRNRSDICPFEKLVAGCEDERECYDEIKSFLKKGKNGRVLLI